VAFWFPYKHTSLLQQEINYGRNFVYDTSTRQEKVANDKHSSLLQKNCKFWTIKVGPCQHPMFSCAILLSWFMDELNFNNNFFRIFKTKLFKFTRNLNVIGSILFYLTISTLCNSSTGWPDWANFKHLATFYLGIFKISPK